MADLSVEISSEDLERIENYTFAAQQSLSGRFAGMTYEEGMQAVIDYLKGDLEIDELLESGPAPGTARTSLCGTEWVVLGNGKEYTKHSILEEVEYWMPNDEEDYIRVKAGDHEQDTGFYEMDDFLHEGSDYRMVLQENGTFLPKYKFF